MKKAFLTACSLFLVFNMTACSSTPSAPSVQPSSSQPQTSSTLESTPNSTPEPSEAALGNVNADAPVIYMTADISSDSLMAIYKALGVEPSGNVAVKLHSGEGESSNYLRPDFIKELVQTVNGTIVECNTAYGGSRASATMHLQVMKDRGFTDIAEVDIMDANGEMTIPVTGGTHLKENVVGETFSNYDYFVVLSHFKGHAMGGFGGALKNISIGIASSKGKSLIHTAGKSNSGLGFDTSANDFTESMAEAAKSVSNALDGNMLYINVMNRLSVDCDCNARPAEPDMHDIGILASLDPVALDKACLDLVYASPDGKSLINRIESRNGGHIVEHAAAIGLGSMEYNLVSIDN